MVDEWEETVVLTGAASADKGLSEYIDDNDFDDNSSLQCNVIKIIELSYNDKQYSSNTNNSINI